MFGKFAIKSFLGLKTVENRISLKLKVNEKYRTEI